VSAVLVVRPSSLGDVVYALAVVDDIRTYRPELAIDWVVEPGFASVVGMCPDVRRTLVFALRRWRKAPLARATWRDVRAFRRDLRTERYDAVLNLQEQMKGALIARAARGTRHGFDRASVREPLATLGDDVHHRVPREAHFVVRCRTLAASALGYSIDGPPRFRLAPPADVAGIPERHYVVVLHSTSRDDKLWPEAHWRTIIGELDRAGYAIVLPWGSADEEARSRSLAEGIAGAIVPAWLTIPAAATLIARAELAIGVDTGFTHLAAALGTPTIALFVATDRARHGVAAVGAHGRDLGDVGTPPSIAEVRTTAGALLRMSALE
jgi:heptosyltransferase-1